MRAAFLATVAVLGASTFAVAATDSEAVDAQEMILQSVRIIRRSIELKGSEQARATDRRVNFFVDRSVVPYAASSSDTSSPKIRISTEYHIVLGYFSRLTIVGAKDTNFGKCDFLYGTYVYERLAENARRAVQNRYALEIESPEGFARRIGGFCTGLAQGMDLSDREKAFAAETVFYASEFVYLHELGHVVLGHRPIGDEIFAGLTSDADRMKAFLAGTKRSRAQEYEADAWATRELLYQEIPAEKIVALPLLRMLIASSGIDCNLSTGMTHPMGVDRFAKIASIVRQNGSVRAELVGPMNDLIAFAEHVKSTLHCPD